MNTLTKTRYTEEQVRYILNNFQKNKYKEIARILGRTVKAVKQVVRSTGFTKWGPIPTKSEIEKVISEKFPKIQRTNLELYLIDHYENELAKDIADKFNVTYSHVRGLIERKLKLATKKKYVTEQELQYIKHNYGKIPVEDICKELDRTKSSIQLLASRNDIYERPRWSRQENEILKNNYKYLSSTQLGKLLGRTKRAVERQVSNLKLSKGKRTSIELMFSELLKEKNINFKEQVRIARYRVDFIVGTVVFETYGTFWHCDPRVYVRGPEYKAQKVSFIRDKKKIEYLKSKGYEVYIIWEKDLNENYEEVKQKVTAVLRGDP